MPASKATLHADSVSSTSKELPSLGAIVAESFDCHPGLMRPVEGQPSIGDSARTVECLEDDLAWKGDQSVEETDYEVSRVVAQRTAKRAGDARPRAYLRVRWVGWSAEADTWERAEGFTAKDKVKEFVADEAMCKICNSIERLRCYLVRGCHYADGDGLKVTKTDRGLVRVALARQLYELSKVMAKEDALNVLGSPIYDSSRRVPQLLAKLESDFTNLAKRGYEARNVKDQLVDIPYKWLVPTVTRLCEQIMEAIHDEQVSNDRSILEEMAK